MITVLAPTVVVDLTSTFVSHWVLEDVAELQTTFRLEGILDVGTIKSTF